MPRLPVGRRYASSVASEAVMDAELLKHARAAKGFMPDDEGLALHEAALAADKRAIDNINR